MSWENRSWSFVKIDENGGYPSGSLDFTNVRQPNFNRCTKDGKDGSPVSEFMIKWDGAEPADIAIMNANGQLAKYNVNKGTGQVTSGSGNFVFDHEETLLILQTPRWKTPTE
jgi:hypothetical protein